MSTGTRSNPASTTGNQPAQHDTRQALREWQESQQSPNQPAWNTARFVLRITSMLFAVPLLGLSIPGFVAPAGFSALPALGTPLAAAAIIFDVAEFIVTCVRKKRQGMRPAISLGFELVISMVGIALSGLLIYFTVVAWSWRRYYAGDGNGRLNTPVPDYVANGYFWVGIQLAASVLATLLSLVHFVLFVRDCVEVDRQRKATRKFREMAASKDPITRQESTVGESTLNHPAPSYSAVETASELGDNSINEPSKDVAFSKDTYAERYEQEHELHSIPIEPKSRG